VPVYEYTCQKCRTAFERLVKSISADAAVRCPKCGSTRTSRSLSVFAVGTQTHKTTDGPAGICGRCGGPGPCTID